jgi:hypothetical protein
MSVLRLRIERHSPRKELCGNCFIQFVPVGSRQTNNGDYAFGAGLKNAKIPLVITGAPRTAAKNLSRSSVEGGEPVLVINGLTSSQPSSEQPSRHRRLEQLRSLTAAFPFALLERIFEEPLVPTPGNGASHEKRGVRGNRTRPKRPYTAKLVAHITGKTQARGEHTPGVTLELWRKPRSMICHPSQAGQKSDFYWIFRLSRARLFLVSRRGAGASEVRALPRFERSHIVKNLHKALRGLLLYTRAS